VHVYVVLDCGALVLKVAPREAGASRVDASLLWSGTLLSCGESGGRGVWLGSTAGKFG